VSSTPPTGSDGIAQAAQRRPDAGSADLGLPISKAWSVEAPARIGAASPVIILSVRDREDDKVPRSTRARTIT